MKLSTLISIALGVILCSCSITKPVAVQTQIETHYVDSLRIKDSTIYHTEVLVKDYAVPPDTLYLQGQHASATAFLDTALIAIKGTLKEDPWKEKIVYKDRIVYRDTALIKEVPKEIEVVKKVVPKWCWYLLAGNILLLLAVVLAVAFKLKF